MKKQYLFFAAAALSVGMASCSSDEMIGDSPQKSQAQALNDGGVYFDVYTSKGITRGGVTGNVTTADLKDNSKDLGKAGFGVFGYYTDNNEYDQRSTPNFFYNQQVTFDGGTLGAWTYEPLKYWPNEYGKDAVSDDQDLVTYFAYAPWVDVIPTNGKLRETDKDQELWGITGMTKNTAQGDPLIKYIASFNNKKSVDLCWGVADNDDGMNWTEIQGGTKAGIKNGKPWINVKRPAETDQKVKFTFKHATAQMRMTIDADIDNVHQNNPIGSKELHNKSRVWVRSVTLRGIAMKGTLNLNNDEASTSGSEIPTYRAYWLDYNGLNELVAEDVIVLDGRKDGKEGVNGAIATNEKVLGLNPALVQDGLYTDDSGMDVNTAGNKVYEKGEAIKVTSLGQTGTAYERPGVTKTTVDLFADNDLGENSTALTDGKGTIFHVIPTDEEFEIEIVYDIETVDPNLAQNLSDGATKGSSIENRITKKVSFGNQTKLINGHSYTLALHLGLNSVKFDAAVTDWIDEPAQEVDLPSNAPVLSWNGTGSVYEGFIGAKDKKFEFQLAPDAANMLLQPGETVSCAISEGTWNSSANTKTTDATSFDSWSANTAIVNPVQTNGYMFQQLTTTDNPTTCDRTIKYEWTGLQSGNKAAVVFTQAAHPLELKISTATPNTSEIQLGAFASLTYGWCCKGLADGCTTLTATTNGAADAVKAGTANGIVVEINGSQLEWAATLGTGKYTFDDATGKITLHDNNKLVEGSVIKVWLKTGDAPVEVATKVVKTVAP